MLNNSTFLDSLPFEIIVILIPEIVATLYWQKYPAKYDESIAILGDDLLVSRILRQGLCLNLYSCAQNISYHIWAKSRHYYYGVDHIKIDNIIFHEQCFEEHISLLMGVKRIVLCFQQDENKKILAFLRSHRGCPPIFIYKGKDCGLLFDNVLPPVISFGDKEDILHQEILLKELFIRNAKTQTQEYCLRYGGKTWQQLSFLERLCNVASSIYFPVLLRLYKAGTSFESLMELEHICRCRVSLLMGYEYGSTFNSDGGILPPLVSYCELTEEERQVYRNIISLAIELYA